MLRDQQNLEISNSDEHIVHAVDSFTQQLLSLGPKIEEIIPCAQENPDNTIVNLYAALMYAYSQEKTGLQQGQNHLQQAQTTLSHANTREKFIYQLLSSYYNLDYDNLLNSLESFSQTWPNDIVIAKFAEFIFFLRGQSYFGTRFLQYIKPITEFNSNNSHVVAMHAFASELAGFPQQAEQLANKALELEPATPWAHHALAHHYFNRKQFIKGSQFLEKYKETWQQACHLIEAHNQWHLALFYLSELNYDKVMSIYYEYIWCQGTDLVGELIDAISLLWRLELAGYDVKQNTWHEIAEKIQNFSVEHYIPFLNAHFIYALSRASQIELVDISLDKLAQFSQFQIGHSYYVWQTIAIPFFQACKAYALNQYNQCADLLTPIIAHIRCIGGSDAQVELFNQVYLNALIKAKQLNLAQQYFKQIIGSKPVSPLAEYWFSKIN